MMPIAHTTDLRACCAQHAQAVVKGKGDTFVQAVLHERLGYGETAGRQRFTGQGDAPVGQNFVHCHGVTH
jgi:hypothetical protein